MRAAGDDIHGARMRALIVLLWRAGLRINEALTLTEHHLDARLGAILVRHGKGGRRREVGIDSWGWEHLRPWLELRVRMPVRAAFVRDRRTDPWPALGRRRRPRPAPARRRQGRRAATVRAPPAPPRPPVELAHEGVPLNVIQRQLGHTNLGVTSIYLQGIDNAEIIATVHARKAPMIPASTRLRL